MKVKQNIVFIVMMILAMAQGLGQGLTGTIRGDVKDQTGGVVPGATVTLTSVSTGEVRTVLSSDMGSFSFANLAIGGYDLKVELSGFKTYVRSDIQVVANRIGEVSAMLMVGDIGETVMVTGGTELIQTEDTQLTGGTFSSREITELPLPDPSLSGGDPVGLAIFTPGTTTQSGGVVGQGGSIGGNRPRQNNFVVDGVDNNDPSLTGPLAPVIQESVEEFTLLTNQFSAEYGHSTAGQFVTTTRSGTNEIHGRAWWYGQNRNLNSLDNLTRSSMQAGDEKPNYDWNRFGGQAGGPILKDKLFYFGSYEYRNLTLGGTSPGQILVPTSAGLSTLKNLAANPDSGVSPTTVGILSDYVPTAGTALQTTDVLNEATGEMVPVELGAFSTTTPQFDRTHLMLLSGDYRTESHNISARYHYSRNRQISPGELPVASFDSDVFADTHRATVTDTFTLSPTMINEFRVGFNRMANGFPVDLPPAPGPTDTFGNYSINDISLFVGPQGTFPQGSSTNVYQATNNFTFVKGSHTFKVGVDYRNVIAGDYFLPRSRGEYAYANLDEFARDRFPSVVSIRGVGNGLFAQNRGAAYGFFQDKWQVHPRLTLDLGLRYEYTQVARDSGMQELNGLANIGSVRDEVYTPDLLAFLGLPADDPLLGTKVFDSLPQEHQSALLSHVGDSLIFRKPDADRNNFAPRIGIGWDVFGDGKTSLRAGIGVAHDVLYGNLAMLQLPPQIQAENRETNACVLQPSPGWCNMVAPGGSPLNADIRYSTMGFLEGGGLLTTLPKTTMTDMWVARAATQAWVENDKLPETYTWSLAAQHKLFEDYMVELRYVGTHAVFLPVQRWKSAGVPNSHRLPVFLSESDAVGTNFNGASTLNDFLANRNLLLLPYGFGGVMTQFTPDGQSWYHGGSIAVQKRFSKGFAFNTSYTWSKTIDYIENDLFTSFMNPRRPFNHLDPAEGRGVSGLHHGHKFVIGWIWEVPKLEVSNGFVDTLLNGWQLNGTYLAESGQPLTVISRRDLNGDFDTAGDTGFENPNGTAGTGTDVNFVCWDGSAAFIGTSDAACGGPSGVVGYVPQDPSARYIRGGLGAKTNMGRGSYVSPGINVWNLGFFKNIDLPVMEGARLQFRVELWNALNHPNFVIGNGSAFNTTTAATSFPGYVTPGTSQFLDKTIFSGGLGNAPFQRVVQWGLRLIF